VITILFWNKKLKVIKSIWVIEFSEIGLTAFIEHLLHFLIPLSLVKITVYFPTFAPPNQLQ